jgi:hypothetical protein
VTVTVQDVELLPLDDGPMISMASFRDVPAAVQQWPGVPNAPSQAGVPVSPAGSGAPLAAKSRR